MKTLRENRPCSHPLKAWLWLIGLVFCFPVVCAAVGHAPDRILVKFRQRLAGNETNLLSGLGLTEREEIPHTGVKVMQVAPARLEAALSSLKSDPKVEFAEEDAALEPCLVPNDPYFSIEWHLTTIAAPAAWDVTTGSSSVIIAILDTGVDGTHPDLAPNLVAGWNTFDNNSNTTDVNGHGTWVAGTAGAAGNNGTGVASVAFGCKLMPVRISDTSGIGYASTIASGLTWAADHGARVANVSYEVTGISTVSSAASYFQSKGGVVTVAAGNEGTVLTLADDPTMITVSATDSSDAIASFSNTGTPIDLAAPGAGIETTTVGGGYGSATGTSFSAPTVAGVAALVISANPNLSSSQVEQVLKQSADDLGAAGWDPVYGWGRVNAQKAVNMAVSYGQVPGSTNQIWGRVLWAGQPVAGAVVSTPNGTNTAQATTAADGSYVLKNLASATSYLISCSSAGLTFTAQFANPVLLSGNLYGADFYADQPPLPLYTVSGQITDPVNPVSGVEVRGGGMVTSTDANGDYQFTNFPNGSYVITPRAANWSFSPASLTVTVNSVNSAGNNFSRVAPYTVTGCIYGVPAGSSSPAPTVYLSNGSSVAATRKGSGPNRYWSYSLAGVPGGQYGITAELAGYSMSASWGGGLVNISGNLSSMNFTGTVASVAGSISGRVTEVGLPVPGIAVQASQNGTVIGASTTDSDGFYRISNLAGGSYAVATVNTGFTVSPLSAAAVTVPASGVNFSLSPPVPAPVISSVAANPALVTSTGSGSTLSVAATGAGLLSFSWDATGGPGPVMFSSNDGPGAGTTTVSFELPGQYTFRVRVTDTNGFASTGLVSVSVLGSFRAMAVTPYQAQIQTGQTVLFSAKAWDDSGAASSVSANWAASGGGTIEQAGTFTGTIPGGPFAVVATTAQGQSATGFVWVSGAALAGIGPSFTLEPTNMTVIAGASVSLVAAANGTAPLTYQWLFNGTAVPGATANSYSLTNVGAGAAGEYAVRVSNSAGWVTSSNATLVVLTPPTISSEPGCEWVAAGTDVTFSVQAMGSEALSYQWLLGGEAISGATASALTITNVQTSDAGVYSVEVSNMAGTVVSSNATLTVNNPPVLQPDSFQMIHQGMTLVVTNEATDTDVPAQTLLFSLAAGAPTNATLDASSGIFTWTPDTSYAGSTNVIGIIVSDSGIPSLSATQNLSVAVMPPVAFKSAGVSNGVLNLSWESIAGVTYRIEYKNNLNDAGWTSLADVVATGPVSASADSADLGQRFYRISVVQ